MEPNCERSEDRVAIGLGSAVESDFDMLEAGLDGYPVSWKERELRRAAGKSFERRQSVGNRELPDGIHLRVEVHGGEARSGIPDFGNPGSDLKSHVGERVGGHKLPPVKRRVSQIG